jgi:hypothetical protein
VIRYAGASNTFAVGAAASCCTLCARLRWVSLTNKVWRIGGWDSVPWHLARIGLGPANSRTVCRLRSNLSLPGPKARCWQVPTLHYLTGKRPVRGWKVQAPVSRLVPGRQRMGAGPTPPSPSGLTSQSAIRGQARWYTSSPGLIAGHRSRPRYREIPESGAAR